MKSTWGRCVNPDSTSRYQVRIVGEYGKCIWLCSQQTRVVLLQWEDQTDALVSYGYAMVCPRGIAWRRLSVLTALPSSRTITHWSLVERYRLDKKNPHTLKQKCLHFDEILIIVCSGSCQMTTSSEASDGNFVKMTTFSFQCITNKLTGCRSAGPARLINSYARMQIT